MVKVKGWQWAPLTLDVFLHSLWLLIPGALRKPMYVPSAMSSWAQPCTWDFHVPKELAEALEEGEFSDYSANKTRSQLQLGLRMSDQ